MMAILVLFVVLLLHVSENSRKVTFYCKGVCKIKQTSNL